jgi:plastocyanin
MKPQGSWRLWAGVFFGFGAWISSLLIQDSAPPLALVSSSDTGTGKIKGTVRIESQIQPKSLAFNLYARRGRPPAATNPQTPVNELENIVLYLEPQPRNSYRSIGIAQPEFENPHSAKSPSIQQVNETFVPHVLPITAGTVVNFPNGDPFFHNVFSLSSAKSFDLGRYPKSQVRSIRFERPGIVKVFCHIHSHMSAVILVFDHPYFCVPDSSGRFSMRPVPPGIYTLVAWHERLKPRKRSVTVTPGGEASLDMVL